MRKELKQLSQSHGRRPAAGSRPARLSGSYLLELPVGVQELGDASNELGVHEQGLAVPEQRQRGRR